MKYVGSKARHAKDILKIRVNNTLDKDTGSKKGIEHLFTKRKYIKEV